MAFSTSHLNEDLSATSNSFPFKYSIASANHFFHHSVAVYLTLLPPAFHQICDQANIDTHFSSTFQMSFVALSVGSLCCCVILGT